MVFSRSMGHYSIYVFGDDLFVENSNLSEKVPTIEEALLLISRLDELCYCLTDLIFEVLINSFDEVEQFHPNSLPIEQHI